ncbi:DNA/RNA non-specific endonuclease [Rhizobium leguminosarum]|uniref:DNA/RNA non-specific endonuclease n=1 Tax=Rhizobium leguminosarum TaxID=384 RepID=UPI0013DA2E08|nr:DNA/RNA non-specific endonuclease [Rhizobium leguminosarum]NEK35624.1 trypsin-like serine protease [Rhizobium leguminosarum]
MRQIESLKHSKNFDRVLVSAMQRLSAVTPPPTRREAASGADMAIEATAESLSKKIVPDLTDFRGPTAGLEAIILAEMRPPYFIVEDEIQIVGDYDRVDLIRDRKILLEASARNVGRVDLLYHPTQEFVGTGWLIEKDIVVTNRHVAEFFTNIDRNGDFQFKNGVGSDHLVVMMDYVRQYQSNTAPRRAFASEVLYIAAQHEPDFAFLRVEAIDGAEPVQIATRRSVPGQPVAAVGYPAWDGQRNDPQLMASLFGGVYDVKRFSPGLIVGDTEGGVILQADYTSLGGNSGSAVIDLDTADVVGLHFGGVFRQTNSAVAIDIVAAALRRMKTQIAVGALPAAMTNEVPSAPDIFSGRMGYNPHFLGKGGLAAPMPQLGLWASDVAPVSDDADSVLKYEHFSTIQSKSRRLPLITAVNIDGERQRKLDREGDWALDGRIAHEHQIGNELYRNNRLDRGHMVRRRDPGWGTPDEASQGEADTFHYTNSVPQHEDLNQKSWVRLEDYLLLSAETRGFKASVFTGPVLRSTDRRLKGQPGVSGFQVPEEFWKVAVMVNAQTKKLHATAYVLSHGPLIRDMTETAFVYGQHETYQVKVAFVEQVTGLDFGKLRNFDPLGTGAEGVFGSAARRISRREDLVL